MQNDASNCIAYANEVQRRGRLAEEAKQDAKLMASGTHKAELCQVTQRVYFLTDIVTCTFDESIMIAVAISSNIIDYNKNIAQLTTVKN